MDDPGRAPMPPWVAARTLAERSGDAASPAGRRRADVWRDALGDDLLAARAAAAGIAPDALPAALSGEPGPDVAQAGPPAWWRLLDAAFRADPAPDAVAGVPADTPVEAGGRHVAAFLVAAVRRELAAHPHARPDAVALLAAGAARGLAGLCRRAVALDLAASRLVEGWPADEVDARADALAATFAAPGPARALLADNPALARMIADRMRLTARAGGELLERLHADLPRVREELLDGRATDRIVALDALGDRHDGGRRVTRIAFASGARVMLKPRSLRPDAAYYALLHALAERGLTPGFRTPRTLAVGTTHGWQEVVEPADCADDAAVTRYIRRLGAQLAVLHALHATDAHQENLVAAGEHPVLIDVETLLQPRLGADAADVIDPRLGPSGVESVLRVGLLPHADAAIGADLSGIGRDPDARADVGDGGWMSAAGGPAGPDGRRLPAGDNAARVAGRPVRPQDHADALASGFADAYDALLAHRDELLAPGGALAALGEHRVRVLLRPTQSYAFVLRQLVVRDACLADGLAREEVLNVLWRSAGERPDLRAAAAAEHHDLTRGDVPRFEVAPGAADLHHHALGPLPGALGAARCPGPDAVRRLTPADRDRQVSLLRTAVVASAREGRDPAREAPAGPVDPAALAAGAAARLELLALRDGDRAAWLALADREPPREGAALTGADAGLVDGQAGIAAALTAAGVEPLAAAARAHLAELAAARPADGAPTAEDAGLVLARGALGAGDPAAARARWLGAADPQDPALPAWTLAGAALARRQDGDDVRRALARHAARLATADDGAAPAALRAGALADAAAALGDRSLAAAAHAVLARAAGETTARLVAALILHDAAPGPDAAAVLGAALDAVATAGAPAALAPALAAAAAARAAGRVLGPDDDDRAARVAARVADAPAFRRGLEVPGLRDGHAGVVLAGRALADGALSPGLRAALLLAATAARPVLPSRPPTAPLELARA